MTMFLNANFNKTGEYVTYNTKEGAKFIARFKYTKGSKAAFIKFLIKNFTVEEYFAKLETTSPLTILEEKGFVQPNVKKLLIAAGFPATQEGFKAYIAKQISDRK